MSKRELIPPTVTESGGGFGKESGFGFASVTLHNLAVDRGALETLPTVFIATYL
jgi:hypothetical protein